MRHGPGNIAIDDDECDGWMTISDLVFGILYAGIERNNVREVDKSQFKVDVGVHDP